MQHRGSRFFDGYERDSSGKLIYTGPRYGYPGAETQRRIKLQSGLLTLGMLAGEILAQFFPSLGGMQRYMAIPSLLSLVPLIFWIMGEAELLMAKQSWELRIYYSGYRRLYRSGIWEIVLCGLWLLGELWFLIRQPVSFVSELLYLICILLCLTCAVLMTVLLRKHPPQVVEGPKVR